MQFLYWGIKSHTRPSETRQYEVENQPNAVPAFPQTKPTIAAPNPPAAAPHSREGLAMNNATNFGKCQNDYNDYIEAKASKLV